MVVAVAERIEPAKQTAHAGTGDHVHRDPKVFNKFDHTQMRQSARPAAGKHEGYRRPVTAYGIHLDADPCQGEGVAGGIHSRQYLGAGQKGNQ